MSAYKWSTGTPMGFDWSFRHRWGSWEVGRTQRWRECRKCDQVDSEDLVSMDLPLRPAALGGYGPLTATDAPTTRGSQGTR